MTESKRELPQRLPPIADAELTPAQRAAVTALLKTPRSGLRGPFVAMLHSPELLDRAQRLGEYLRFGDSLSSKLREFAILIIAQHWSQNYEWYVHAPLAEKVGLNPATIQQVAAGQRPARMDAQESAIYTFCTELLRSHGVTDPTYAAVHEFLGDRGMVDLCGICGYYSMLAMIINVADHELPDGAPSVF